MKNNNISYDQKRYIKNKDKILARQKQYREKHKEEIRARRKKNYEKNKDTILAQNKIYRDKNKKEINTNRRKAYKKNKNIINARNKASYQKHKSKRAATSKIYRETHKEEIKIKDRKYYCKNKKKLIAKAIKYAKEHPEQTRINRQKYEKNNPEKVKASKNRSSQKRKKNDPVYRIRKAVSSFIAKVLKRFGGSKNGESCFKYLPYTKEELKAHIESLFEPWMNWNNQGVYRRKTWDDNDPSTWKWQLDHIIPISKFPHKSMKEKNFRRAWALKNLRPLSAKQNVIDNNRRKRKVK